MKKALAGIITTLFVLGGIGFAQSAVATPIPTAALAGVTGATLSPVGERAVEDVRRCLSSSDVLNVFYLIDNSGSLAATPDGGPGTDEDFRRVDIINQSLRSLSELTEGSSAKNINLSLGFFASSFSPAVGWTPLTKNTVSELESRITTEITINQRPNGLTNWEAGVTQAHRAIQEQQSVSPGCQMMVWLTDGGINVDRSIAAALQSGVNLCGTDFSGEGYSPIAPNGTFNSLRQSGVAVFAVLLNVNGKPKEWREELLQPLAEGSGQIQGQSATCGVNPIPENFTAGAYIEADSVGSLSNEFLKLAARLSGGSDATMISKDKISVPKGVARLQVIGVDAGAILTSPSGRAIMPSVGSDGFIDAQVLNDAEYGTWSVTATGWSPPAIVWGALVLVPERDPKAAGGAEQSVRFTLDTAGSTSVAVTDYDFTLAVRLTYPDGTQETQSIPSTELVSGANTLVFEPNPAYSEVQIRYTTENLRTKQGQVPLAAIVAEQNVTITPPTQFPTVSNPAITQALIGSITPAQGTFTITAPADGNPGEVCFPGLSSGELTPAPTIVGDSADRLTDWQWSIAATDQASVIDDCVQLAPGAQTTVAFSASHPSSADSAVQALTTITLGDGSGGVLPITKEIVFPSERIYFPVVGNIVRIVLIALGIILPFLVLYLVALLTTKGFHGRELRRATFPVIYNTEKKTLVPADGKASSMADLGKDAFTFLTPIDDFKKFNDPELGTLSAVVSANPLRAPWFEITPRAGTTVFTDKTAPPIYKKRFEGGQKALFSGDMSKLWALSFSESELAKPESGSDDIRGKLVVFSRDSFGASVNMQDTMAGILNSLRSSNAIAEAQKVLHAKQHQKDDSKGNKPGTTGGKPVPTLPPLPGRSPGSFTNATPPAGGSPLPPLPPRPGSRP